MLQTVNFARQSLVANFQYPCRGVRDPVRSRTRLVGYLTAMSFCSLTGPPVDIIYRRNLGFQLCSKARSSSSSSSDGLTRSPGEVPSGVSQRGPRPSASLLKGGVSGTFKGRIRNNPKGSTWETSGAPEVPTPEAALRSVVLPLLNAFVKPIAVLKTRSYGPKITSAAPSQKNPLLQTEHGRFTVGSTHEWATACAPSKTEPSCC
jgi:hypothetical protein